MTPEQRLKRVERILGRLATRGRRARSEFRDKINILIDTQIRSEEEFRGKINILLDAQIRGEEEFHDKINILTNAQIRNEEEFHDKINILTNAQMRNENAWRAESHATNEQIKATNEQIKNVAIAQAELTKSQKLTERALRDFINSHRKRQN